MAFSIKNDEADHLARRLAELTGESLTEAVLTALRERLRREETLRRVGVGGRLRRLAAEVAELPIVDDRPPDELIGYDRAGLPR
jgi:antitoxin VapB